MISHYVPNLWWPYVRLFRNWRNGSFYSWLKWHKELHNIEQYYIPVTGMNCWHYFRERDVASSRIERGRHCAFMINSQATLPTLLFCTINHIIITSYPTFTQHWYLLNISCTTDLWEWATDVAKYPRSTGSVNM